MSSSCTEVVSNGSSMDQVFEEECRRGEQRERGGLGVEPVLSTSYSANDVSNLQEEAALSGAGFIVPR